MANEEYMNRQQAAECHRFTRAKVGTRTRPHQIMILYHSCWYMRVNRWAGGRVLEWAHAGVGVSGALTPSPCRFIIIKAHPCWGQSARAALISDDVLWGLRNIMHSDALCVVAWGLFPDFCACAILRVCYDGTSLLCATS